VVSDPDPGDTVNLTTSASDASVVTANVSGNTLTISGQKQGSAGINVIATDSRGLRSTASFVVTVTDPIASNRGPTIAAIGAQSVDASQTIDVSFTATDPDGDVLTLSATSGNNGVASAVIVGTNIVRVNGVSGGSTSITVRANDNKGGIATTSFNVTVVPPPSPNNAPTISAIGNQMVDVGNSTDVTAQTNDADGDPVSLSTTTNPTGIASISVNSSVLTVTGDSAGTTTVTVTASDGTDSVQTTFNVTVNAPAGNNAPTISAIGPQNVTEGTTFDLNVSANDIDGDPLTYSATFNPGGVASQSSVNGSVITISGDSAGVTTVTVTVDDGTDSATTDFSLTVDAPAPTNSPPTVDPNYTGQRVFYVFLLGVAAVGGVIYLFVAGLFPGLKEERFGVLEPLPENLGKWLEDADSEAGREAVAQGQKREVRLLYEAGGLLNGGKLLRQARLRDGTTNKILTVLPEEVVKRRRVRQRA
jgi:hypothetical protein